MPKFTIQRRTEINEQFSVEAENAHAARDVMEKGGEGAEPIGSTEKTVKLNVRSGITPIAPAPSQPGNVAGATGAARGRRG